MHNRNPEFYLNSGDLVGTGSSQLDWDAFWGIVGPKSNDTVYFPSIGNHDLPGTLYLQYFSLPGYERYYTFDYSNAHFIVLDTNIAYNNGSAQNDWLRNDLDAADDWAEWIFVFYHHPPYSSGSHGSSINVRQTLNPILEQHNVTAVFNGHDHCYEHAEPGNGIHYFVTGGGGAPLYAVGTSWFTTYSESTHHYIILDVNDNITLIRAYRDDDTLMETVRIAHPDTRSPEPVPVEAFDTGLGGQIFVNWSSYNESAQGDVAEYRLFLSTSDVTDVTGLTPDLTFSPGQFTTTIDNLQNNTLYYVAVVAVDEVSNYNPTVIAATATPTDSTPPGPPQGLTISGATAHTLNLSWDQNPEPDLAGYRIYMNDSGSGPGGPYSLLADVSLNTSFTATDLAMNTTYGFVVDAIDMAVPVPNNSTLSAPANGTTLLIIPNGPPVLVDPPVDDIHIFEDAIDPYYLAFDEVFFDPDGDELEYYHEEAISLAITQSTNGSGIEIIPLPDYNGETSITLAANDTEFNTSTEIAVVVEPVNDLPVLYGVPETVEFYEDLRSNFSFSASDFPDFDLALEITTDFESSIPGVSPGGNYWLNCTASIYDPVVNCSVEMMPDYTMVGTYTGLISVMDSEGAIVTQNLSVIIQNTNDYPALMVVTPDEGDVFEFNETIQFFALADDLDLAHGDSVDIVWRSDPGGIFGYGENASAVLAPGDYTIVCTAIDLSGAATTVHVNITVKEEVITPPPPPPPPPPSINQTDGLWLFGWLALVLVVVVLIISVVIAVVLYIIIRKKQNGPPGSGPPPTGQPPQMYPPPPPQGQFPEFTQTSPPQTPADVPPAPSHPGDMGSSPPPG
jgi:hypothetical protein